ncbi:HNH endonuclease signature motif containing protein [Arthrobacter sp. Soil763]|uniref:HNH endonuclease signature motif containing protein n=1 Tax=Arthrobacter sp. Soil763 TaxID=1736402 RepID=UPI0006FA2B36|nr:HNH endonuclease signature motif containing protein [Arthrobacter sp. Soil763]KRE80241.1 endonuclease [Arthrobacter sp. Soil763]
MESGDAFTADIRAAAAALRQSAAALEALLDGPGAAESNADADPVRLRADACLDGLSEAARVESRVAALKVRLAAGYVHLAEVLAGPAATPQDWTAREMSTVAEVAGVLTVSERSASALISDALALTTSLPLTLDALGSGSVSWQHARIMVNEAAGLSPAAAGSLEAHFLDPDAPSPARGCLAGELVPGRFRAKARTWRERHHPLSIEARHVRSAADRRVEFVPDRDGMAWLNAYLPAATAAGIFDRLTTASRALQGPAEARTLAQLRADVAATLFLSGEGAAGRVHAAGTGDADTPLTTAGVPMPRAQVLVTVPVLSLLGVTDEPAMLDGYGPIPPSVARKLVAGGADSFYRVLTDPRDGAPLEIGRTSYRIPRAMRHWLRLRDAKCSFPACNNSSLDTEADHLLAWANGGTTGISNLGQPCRKHHRLKHTTTWTPTPATGHEPPAWISPTGRRYRSEQQDWEPPHLPDTPSAFQAAAWSRLPSVPATLRRRWSSEAPRPSKLGAAAPAGNGLTSSAPTRGEQLPNAG